MRPSPAVPPAAFLAEDGRAVIPPVEVPMDLVLWVQFSREAELFVPVGDRMTIRGTLVDFNSILIVGGLDPRVQWDVRVHSLAVFPFEDSHSPCRLIPLDPPLWIQPGMHGVHVNCSMSLPSVSIPSVSFTTPSVTIGL